MHKCMPTCTHIHTPHSFYGKYSNQRQNQKDNPSKNVSWSGILIFTSSTNAESHSSLFFGLPLKRGTGWKENDSP